MCGRFGFIYPSVEDWTDYTADLQYNQQFNEYYENELAKLRARTNITPMQTVETIVFSKRENAYMMVPMRWGWEPPWSERLMLHNSNFQTVMNPSKPTWKEDLKLRRCIIPASFHYDWQVRDDGTKVPWKVERADGRLMFFAGLFQYGPSRKKPEEKILTTTVITFHGNKLMQMLNNDEPPGTQTVFLEENKLAGWLNPDMTEPEDIAKFVRQHAETEIKVTPLFKVGDDKNGILPEQREWMDPYAVATQYYPEPIDTRYANPKPKVSKPKVKPKAKPRKKPLDKNNLYDEQI